MSLEGVFTTGSNLIQRTLPCFPGYAMGGIIRTGDLELPYLEQQKEDLFAEINKIEKRKKNVSQLNDPQKEFAIYRIQVEKLLLTVAKVTALIENYQKEKDESPFSETMLPIDYKRSRLEYRFSSNESENMHFVIIKQQTAKKQIEEFTQHLTKISYLPSVIDLIEQITESVLNQAQHENQEVCLLGSFITLPHGRMIDPIYTRENAVLSKELTNETTAAKYSVISETVLGGVFIGFGIRISKQQEAEQDKLQDIKSITSALQIFSFVSQGAIPQTENFNLWDTYNNWKTRLTTNEHCGFPIAFKVRSLVDVLQENGLLVKGKK